jgi:hypothetical protein
MTMSPGMTEISVPSWLLNWKSTLNGTKPSTMAIVVMHTTTLNHADTGRQPHTERGESPAPRTEPDQESRRNRRDGDGAPLHVFCIVLRAPEQHV